MLRWIASWPLRKPAVVAVLILSILVILHSIYYNVDIPANTSGFLCVFVGAVLTGYFGSSAYESRFNHREDKPNDTIQNDQ
jgi:hypothetical protein